MAHSEKPKLQIKRRVYRIYIRGTYMGTGLTQASAREGAKRMLATYWRGNRWETW
jgi:hypothetical protein